MKVLLDLLPGTPGTDALRRAGFHVLGEQHRRIPFTEHLRQELAACAGTPWVVVQTPSQVREAAALGANLWLRGYEAGGAVSEFSALILMRAARGAPFVVEGLGPRAMAASVAIGAAGIVIGCQTWLAEDAPLCEAHRERLARVRNGRDAQVVDGYRSLRGPGVPSDTWWHHPEAAIPAPQCIGPSAGQSTLDIALALRAQVEAHLDALEGGHPLTADPLGTGRPIVQGPMANVSEGTALATAVAKAGGLPFAAFGALDPEQAAAVLDDWHALKRPFGVGVIGFEMMPWRDAHLELLRKRPPKAVILAGGNPALALDLQQAGLDPWLHTPSGPLARAALERGVRAIVLEGHEAGGHVGQLTSVGLWEEGLAAAEPLAADHPLVVLAGGIGDPTSAAFAAAMAAPFHLAGGRVVLQVGTAFMFTHEIVQGGQITPDYQAAALAASETLLVGATVDLPLRCVPNAYVTEARDLEQAWLRDGVPRSERRERIEHHNLGRTRLAAKGIERDPTGAARYRTAPPERQRAEGAFTMGQGATVTASLGTVAELITRLTDEAAALLPARNPWGPPLSVRGDPSTRTVRERGPVTLGKVSQAAAPIAIVGLGCVLPGGLDLASFWHLLVRGESAIGDIPIDRWRPDRYFDADASDQGPVKTYSRLAGAVRGFEFDPLRYRIPPKVARTMDPSQRLALAAAEQAVRDAGWLKRDGRRAAVVMGNAMGGEFSKSLALRVRFREVLAALQDEGISLSDALTDRIEGRLAADLPPVEVDTMAGLLSNVIAGRIAAWLDWMGGNMTVDAACAASLAAVSVAVDWLRAGRCDAVLTGGVDTDLSAESYVGFSRTRALSTGTSRPFSARADGFVMGEGAGVLALMRLDDALSEQVPVWAVIRGVGQSSDGRGKGITAPRAKGQRLAIERAYAEAGFDPSTVRLVEAHGTGTALGDRTEVGVLSQVFAQSPGPTWLGSAKSNVGHLKGAAGAVGLIKAAVALATGVIPPTVSAGPVNPLLHLEQGPLRLPRKAVPFPGDGPRRASVSAFGFGGTNFHVVLEQPPPEALRPAAAAALAAVEVEADASAAAWPLDEQDGVIVLVPGQGAQRPGAVASLRTFTAGAAALAELEIDLPAVAAEIGLVARHLDDLEGSEDTRALHLLLYCLAVGWAAVLRAADIPIRGALGHSLGEYGALAATGRLQPRTGLRLVARRGAALHDGPPGAMVALPVDEARAQEIAAAHGLTLAAVNAPDRCVLSGPDLGAVATMPGARPLAVAHAFHSPAVATAAEALSQALATVPFAEGVTTWSARTAAPFGVDPSGDLAAALLEPVRFADALAALPDAPLVELGPGHTLTSLAAACGRKAIALDHAEVAAERLRALGWPGLQALLPKATETPTAEPVPTATPEANDAPSDLRDAVVAAICEVTGYPADYLTDGADLEAELGVDSIRKMEILGLLQDRLGFTVREADYADLADASLARLVAYTQERLGQAEQAPPSEARVHLYRLAPLPRPLDDAPPAGTWRQRGNHVRWHAPTDLDAALEQGLQIGKVTAKRLTVWGDGPGAAFARCLCKERGWQLRLADAPGNPCTVPVPLQPPRAALPQAPVVLATGGTRGIVAACLQALPDARIIHLSRTRPDKPVTWFPCDLTDPAAVTAAVAKARAVYGRIDLVVHGAGLLADKPVDRVAPDDVRRVVGAKVTGARNLMAATRDDALALWVTFGSIVAHVGNAGQSVYAAANAALERMQHPTAARSLCLAWTAWSEVGMASAPALQRALAAKGLVSLPPDLGRQAFVEALGAAGTVLVTAAPLSADLPWPLQRVETLSEGSGRLVVHLDPSAPALADHAIAGRPLVPAALWVGALLAAVRVVSGYRGPLALDGFAVHAPTFVEQPRDAVVVIEDGHGQILVGGTVVAEAQVAPCPAPGRTDAPVPLQTARPAEPLYRKDVLFHGASWQVLDRLAVRGPELQADLATSSLDEVAAAVDGAYQLLSAWAGQHTGYLALPVGAGRWIVDGGARSGALRLETRARPSAEGIEAEVRAVAADGRVVLQGETVRLRRAARWPSDGPDTLGGPP